MTTHKRIGLALGSGAAKGWAHIGVIRALQQMGIDADVISGCSIGAFVGATYSNDHLDELEEWVLSFSNWDVVSLMDIQGVRGGLMAGQKVFAAADQILGAGLVEDCRKPFRAVAAELDTGKEVWLDNGKLNDAVRASCSIPGVLHPTMINQRWLVDGATVNPVPVSACRALGADLIIAVDLHHSISPIKRTKPASWPEKLKSQLSHSAIPERNKLLDDKPSKELQMLVELVNSGKASLTNLLTKISEQDDSLPSMFSVMAQSMQIMENRVKRSRMAGDPPELVITPRVGEIRMMDFARAEEAIQAGFDAVERARPQLIDMLELHQIDVQEKNPNLIG